MSVRDCVDEIERLLDEGFSFPGGKKVYVDAEEIRRLLREINEFLPTDIHQAKNIVRDRTEIIEDAKRERDKIIGDAEKRRNDLINDNEITKQAQKHADEMLGDTRRKCAEIRKAANEYVNDLMKRTDDILGGSLNELRAAGKSLRDSQRNFERSLAEESRDKGVINIPIDAPNEEQ